jgi:hypothetical protein
MTYAFFVALIMVASLATFSPATAEDAAMGRPGQGRPIVRVEVLDGHYSHAFAVSGNSRWVRSADGLRCLREPLRQR